LRTVVESWHTIAAACSIGNIGSRHAMARLRSQGPPLVIRFLRLAL
jgi:hypothetical protein